MEDKKVLDIARDFALAATKKQEENEALEIRIADAATVEQLQDYMEAAVKQANLRQRFGETADNITEYADTVIKFADIVAGFHLSVSQFNEVAAMMPEEGKNADVREALVRKGALNLAKLAR